MSDPFAGLRDNQMISATPPLRPLSVQVSPTSAQAPAQGQLAAASPGGPALFARPALWLPSLRRLLRLIPRWRRLAIAIRPRHVPPPMVRAPRRFGPIRPPVRLPRRGDSKFDTSKQHNPGRRRLYFPANDDQAAGDPGDEGTGQPGSKQLEGPQSPQLTIEKSAPPEIQVGKPATFRITVRNTGQAIGRQRRGPRSDSSRHAAAGQHAAGFTWPARRTGLELGHDQAGRRVVRSRCN